MDLDPCKINCFVEIKKNMVNKTVFVLGAGIGGLTAAHVLGQRGFQVHVIEKNSAIGGLARSGRTPDGYPTEYCWRIYSAQYCNLRHVLQEIPTEFPGKTVHDNLIDIQDYVFSTARNTFTLPAHGKERNQILKTMLKEIPMTDKIHVASKIGKSYLYGKTRMEDLDKVSWKDYIGKLKSDYFHKWVVYSLGPILGEDLYNVSAFTILSLMGMYCDSKGISDVSVMNAPTSEAWFNHWQTFLTNEYHVQFHLNSSVNQILVQNGLVMGVYIEGMSNPIVADYYVCGLSVDTAASLFKSSLPNLEKLAELSKQEMVGITMYLNKRIKFPRATVLYFPETPWQLVIEPQGDLWDYKDPKQVVKDIWAIGLCDPRSLGITVQKPYTECSTEEIERETWYQLNTSQEGSKLLKGVRMLGMDLWETFYYDLLGHLQTSEPKFSNNVGCWQLMPTTRVNNVHNLYFATAYTQTPNVIYNMNVACTAGILAANAILTEEMEPKYFYAESKRLHPMLQPFRAIDETFYRKKTST